MVPHFLYSNMLGYLIRQERMFQCHFSSVACLNLACHTCDFNVDPVFRTQGEITEVLRRILKILSPNVYFFGYYEQKGKTEKEEIIDIGSKFPVE